MNERVELRIVRECNQACLFCSASATCENLVLDPAEVERRLAALEGRSDLFVCLTGGEPTISRHLTRYLEAARRHGVPQVIVETNAMRFVYPEFVGQVRSAHPRIAFLVSLHAHRAAVSDGLTRRPGGFDLTVRGIGNLLAAGCEVHLNHVINARNYAGLPDFAAFVADTFPGIAQLVLSYVSPTSSARTNTWLIPRFSAVAPVLHRAIGVLEERQVPFQLADRCGLPLCFLRGFERHFASYDAVRTASVPVRLTDDRIKGPGCPVCRWYNGCSGIWEAYPHGTGELAPVPEEWV